MNGGGGGGGGGGCCCCPTVSNFQPMCNPEPVMNTGSDHGFQSCGSDCGCLCEQYVCYVTEYVTVPVHRPVLRQKFTRYHEVPTQHCVNVKNLPEGCGNNLYGTSYPRDCQGCGGGNNCCCC